MDRAGAIAHDIRMTFVVRAHRSSLRTRAPSSRSSSASASRAPCPNSLLPSAVDTSAAAKGDEDDEDDEDGGEGALY